MDAQRLSVERDEKLAESALEKRRNGKNPSPSELAALDRIQERQLIAWLKELTPKHFRSITLLQAKQMHDWEDRYKIPCGRGRERINFLDVFAALRKLIADFAKGKTPGSADSGTSDKKLERMALQNKRLHEQTKKLQMENLAASGASIPREVLDELHQLLQNDLVTLGEEFARMSSIKGTDAQRKLNATLMNLQRRLNPVLKMDEA